MITSTTSSLIASCSPQQQAKITTGQIMLWVIAACLPAIFLSTYFFGIGVMLNIVLASVFALSFEAVALKLRNKNLRTNLLDNSALVTAVLLGIAIPPGSEWWLILSGVFFAVVIAKHAFGGLGQNLFNPAMCGYAMLLLAFPLDMTSWHIPVAQQADEPFSPLSLASMQTSIQFLLPAFATDSVSNTLNLADGLSMATPLIEQKMAGKSAIFAIFNSAGSWLDLLRRESGAGWELVNIGFMVGGLFLIYKKIISWHIPLSIIGSIVLLSLLFYSENSVNTYGTTYLHLFGSATMIGAFFIATDPVSAATTPIGKLLYGVIIGCCIYSIRVWGSYLDSIAFAVLFGNFCTPLIDHYCAPTIYGHARKRIWKPAN